MYCAIFQTVDFKFKRLTPNLYLKNTGFQFFNFSKNLYILLIRQLLGHLVVELIDKEENSFSHRTVHIIPLKNWCQVIFRLDTEKVILNKYWRKEMVQVMVLNLSGNY